MGACCRARSGDHWSHGEPALSTPAPANAPTFVWEQDAGGRRNFVEANALSGASSASVVAVPLPVQNPNLLTGPTNEAGAARTSVLATMGAEDRGIVAMPRPALVQSAAQFLALQEWEGTVIERREGAVRVRLADKTRQGTDEEAEILIDEISPQDRDLVKPGAVFYWTIGYFDSGNGQRVRQSSIIFRRLPIWTKGDFRLVRGRVRETKALFGWE